MNVYLGKSITIIIQYVCADNEGIFIPLAIFLQVFSSSCRGKNFSSGNFSHHENCFQLETSDLINFHIINELKGYACLMLLISYSGSKITSIPFSP